MIRVLKEAEKRDKLENAKREKEAKQQLYLEEKKRRQEERQEEKLKKLQELELKRQQTAMLKEQVKLSLPSVLANSATSFTRNVKIFCMIAVNGGSSQVRRNVLPCSYGRFLPNFPAKFDLFVLQL